VLATTAGKPTKGQTPGERHEVALAMRERRENQEKRFIGAQRGNE